MKSDIFNPEKKSHTLLRTMCEEANIRPNTREMRTKNHIKLNYKN